MPEAGGGRPNGVLAGGMRHTDAVACAAGSATLQRFARAFIGILRQSGERDSADSGPIFILGQWPLLGRLGDPRESVDDLEFIVLVRPK